MFRKMIASSWTLLIQFWIIAILLDCTIATQTQSNFDQLNDFHGISNHRVVWPIWYRERLPHTRHERNGRINPEVTTTRSTWHRENVTLRPTLSVVTGSSVERMLQQRTERNFDQLRPSTSRSEKFSAVALAEYGGTRAIAYAGYHGGHRHQEREAVTQSYHIATTTPSYTKHHSGRRVCSRQTSNQASHHHHRGRLVRVMYTESSSGFLCCPGWTQVTQLSFGCNQPICEPPCLNGGICSSPRRCTCPKGFTGSQCQTDVNECVTEKPCGQLCRNLHGSYECYCRSGFHLQEDGQSCRKNDSDGTAFEAKDLENDFDFEVTTTTTGRPSTSTHDVENEVGDADLDQDYEIILKRLLKLEKQIAKGKKRDTETNDMNAKLASVVDNINEIKRSIENVHHMQQEIYEMRNKIKQYELETRKIQHLTNRVVDLEHRLRTRCRSILPSSGISLIHHNY